MMLPNFVLRRVHWLNLPGALLIALLQRAPALRCALSAGEGIFASPAGTLLRTAVAATAALGTWHTLAGATQFVQSPENPVTGTVGQQVSVSFTVVNSPTPPNQYTINNALPPGLATSPPMDGAGHVSSGQVTISGVPTQAGTFNVSVTASDGVFSETDSITFVIGGGGSGGGSPPSVTMQAAASQSPSAGGFASFTIATGGSPAPNIQWQRNGSDVGGATGATITIPDVEPTNVGVYRALLTNPSGSVASDFSILGVLTNNKVIGAGTEVGSDIPHPNGNIFDQVLLQGAAASVTADPGQVLRISYIDLNNDIVQIEFAGAGTLSLVLDNASGPAAPTNYNQPNVAYMKGHAGIVITGANATTNVSVFSVGHANAFDPTGAYNFLQPVSPTNDPANNGSALFQGHPISDYDGMADIAFIAIASSDGKFGGVRTANANYFNARGLTGIYAPGVAFSGPVFVGDINASDNATPMLILGSGSDVRITGGDLFQANSRAVQINGFSRLQFVTGSNSHGTIFPAQSNKGRLEQNGADVTQQVVVNPTN